MNREPRARSLQGTAIAFALVWIGAAAPSHADEVQDAFRRAQEAFASVQRASEEHPSAAEEARARYREVADAFARLYTERGVCSAKLFVNAGNAYFFAGDLGRAALFYRRALVLDPREPKARAGLVAVRRRLPWRPPPSPGTDLLRALFFWHEGLSFAARRAAFAGTWLLAFVLLGLARRRRGFLWAAIPCALIASALLGSLAVSASAPPPERQGVILTSVQGRTGDGRSYSPSHSAPLPAGSEVEVLEERGGWLRVLLRDRSPAWVPASCVERLAPPGS
ncbi:MAG: hypothetical protein D6731_15855 [Planctomycetota bacterium]|nr:MAG: hypothetical protein D6731_15855 [Planctomycetota bacterium]